MAEELDRIVQPARPVEALKDPLTEEVIVAWQASMSQREIARTLGISRYRVRQIADQHGLQKPSWRTIQNSRRKWGIDSVQLADGWEWFIPDHE